MYAQLEKLSKLNDETRMATIKDLFGNDAEVMKVLNTMIEKGINGYRETAAKLENQASLRERVDASLNTRVINGKPLQVPLPMLWLVSVKQLPQH